MPRVSLATISPSMMADLAGSSRITSSSECYGVRDVPANRIHVTERSLLIAEQADLPSLEPKFAPLALIAIKGVSRLLVTAVS